MTLIPVAAILAATVLSGVSRYAWASGHYLAWGACEVAVGAIGLGLGVWLRGRAR